ncbi:MAG: UDP-4-amino-4,6-dideoxy-N-acetyl-beta-L-altrosamine transaminase [Thermoleophilia bacterium]|nr:UDP-4-amino-4,6-dideoxy-N-acetyl-beta-L-altrosamine transaminase [Thermoleophilia bacterium]
MKQLPYGHQSIDEADIRAVVDVLHGDWLTQGPLVDEFEAALAARTGAKHAVAFNSGTAALHGACAAARLGDGDEVLTSGLSFSASANCARYVGAMPGFVDIDPSTLEATSDSFVSAAGDNTRGVVPVHFAGRPSDLSALAPLRERGIVVIEDAAHAIGAVGPHGPVGNCAMSDMACFSFHPVKTITTGEGGAVTTNDDELAHRLGAFRTHGIERRAPAEDPEAGGWYYEIDELGMNYRITDLQCALGVSQMTKLDSFLARRNEIAAEYRRLLADTDVELAAPAAEGQRHAYHLVVALLPEHASRRRVYDQMRAAGIGVQVHYVPIYWHPYYARLGFERGLCPEVERVYRRCLSLPVFPGVEDADVERVAATLLDAVAQAG